MFWSDVLTSIFSNEAKRPKISSASSSSKQPKSGHFGMIHKIVNHMKQLHLSGEYRQLNIHEVLEECNSTSAGT